MQIIFVEGFKKHWKAKIKNGTKCWLSTLKNVHDQKDFSKKAQASDDNVQVAKRKRKSNIPYQSKTFTKKNLKKIAFSNKPSTNVSSLSDIGELKESCSFFGAFKLKKSILRFVAAKEGSNFPS